jgi:hypothetical protein
MHVVAEITETEGRLFTEAKFAKCCVISVAEGVCLDKKICSGGNTYKRRKVIYKFWICEAWLLSLAEEVCSDKNTHFHGVSISAWTCIRCVKEQGTTVFEQPNFKKRI